VERRARKAYFAALDALRTGLIAEDRHIKLLRLTEEVRSGSAKTALEHLERVLAAVARREESAPLLPAPTRLLELTASVPRNALVGHESFEVRFAWTIEWLRTRGYLTGMEQAVRWRVESTPAHVPALAVAGD
jgi:hypothetical protein